MASISDNTYNLGTIIPIGSSDLTADDKDDARSVAPGQLSYMRDAFGLRIFQYLRCRQSGGHAKGELASKKASVSANASGGSTITITCAGLTAGAHRNWLAVIANNADTPGAAPESEVAIVASNTSNTIYLDSNRPLSVAAAASDAVLLYSVFDTEDAANGDRVTEGVGICVNGISVDNWGWYQQKGIFPNAKVSANGTTKGQAVIASAAVLGSGALPTQWSGADLVWGQGLADLAGDASTATAPVYLNVFDTPYSGR
jgi:hypothetical protein